MPCACACLIIFPEHIYDLPAPLSPANTVTLPNGIPLLKSPLIR